MHVDIVSLVIPRLAMSDKTFLFLFTFFAIVNDFALVTWIGAVCHILGASPTKLEIDFNVLLVSIIFPDTFPLVSCAPGGVFLVFELVLRYNVYGLIWWSCHNLSCLCWFGLCWFVWWMIKYSRNKRQIVNFSQWQINF